MLVCLGGGSAGWVAGLVGTAGLAGTADLAGTAGLAGTGPAGTAAQDKPRRSPREARRRPRENRFVKPGSNPTPEIPEPRSREEAQEKPRKARERLRKAKGWPDRHWHFAWLALA